MYFPSEIFAHILSFANQYFIPSNIIAHTTVILTADEAAHSGVFTYTQMNRKYLKMAARKRHDLAIAIATRAIEVLQKSYQIRNKISSSRYKNTDADDVDDDCQEDNDYTFPSDDPMIHDVLSCIMKKHAIYATVVAISCQGLFTSHYVYTVVNRYKAFVRQYYNDIDDIASNVMGPHNDDANYDIANNSSVWRCSEYSVDVVNDIYETSGKDIIRCLYDGVYCLHISEILTIDQRNEYSYQVISPTGFTYHILTKEHDPDDEYIYDEARDQLYNSVVVYHLLQGHNPYDVYKAFEYCMSHTRYCTRLIYAIARSIVDESYESREFVQNFLKRTDNVTDWYSGRRLLYASLEDAHDYDGINVNYNEFLTLFKNDSIFDIIQL